MNGFDLKSPTRLAVARKSAELEMDEPTPIDLIIMLKIVEYIEMRNRVSKVSDDVDSARITRIVNHLASGASIGSLFHIDSRAEADYTVGDHYLIGQAGAVGPNSIATGQQFTQLWNQYAHDVDLGALAADLARIRSEMRHAGGGTPEEDVVLSQVAHAEIAAGKNDGPAVMAHLRSAGTWALGVAQKIGAEVAITAIQHALGIKDFS
jgi:hypothetical protein